jgi:hypothetical protein
MRNRSDGSNASQWWDGLPPKVRRRVTQPLAPAARADCPAEAAHPPLSGRELVRDLSSLAVLFALIAVVLMLYLLLAVTLVTG